VLELQHGLLGLVDIGRVLRQTKRNELRAEVVQLAAAGALLRDLAQRDERGGLTDALAARHRLPRLVEGQPGDAVPGPEGAEVDAPARRRLRGQDPGELIPFPGEGLGCLGNTVEVLLERHDVKIDLVKQQPLDLFAPLGPTYDRYANLLSFGQDPRWRRFLVSRIEAGENDTILDVATGTAAVAMELTRRTGCRVVGLDQSEEMLAEGRRRISAAGLTNRIELVQGRAEQLPFADESFAGLTFTYLLRYVNDPAATVGELARVVRPGGTIGMLEFGLPRGIARPAWELWVRAGLPVAGALISPGWREVGSFLGPSIRDFHRRHDVLELWRAAGIENVQMRRVSLGGGLVLWGRKP
jgi:demethylmenaquinone methyltransferase / 2-methoxy-6-polyprenyl-1,4-benzoquinol methylase